MSASSGITSLTDASILSRCKLLKAFDRSNLTSIESGFMLPKNRLVACIAASQPPGTPTPSCLGERNDVTFGMAYALAHLDDNLRHVYPMAIGLSPPELLRRAKSVPPKRMVCISCGQVPDSKRLTSAVIALSKPGPESGSPNSSDTC